MNSYHQAILDTFVRHGGTLPMRAVRGMRIASPQTIYRLRKKGWLETKGYSVWQITHEGRMALLNTP